MPEMPTDQAKRIESLIEECIDALKEAGAENLLICASGSFESTCCDTGDSESNTFSFRRWHGDVYHILGQCDFMKHRLRHAITGDYVDE